MWLFPKPVCTARGLAACSGGTHSQVDDYAVYAGDVRARFAGATSPPAFAAGQSMGGLLATHLVLRDQAAWDGLILCSAAIDLEWNLVTRFAALCRKACMLQRPAGCRSTRIHPAGIIFTVYAGPAPVT